MASRYPPWLRALPLRARALIACALLASGTGATDDATGSWFASEHGSFRASFTSRLQPLAINRIHDWTLHVETPAGEPVVGAAIQVAGGMPAHDHGLPTVPAVTRELGAGDYLVEGLRFHMNGYWELRFTIAVGETADTVVIPLTL